MLTRLLPVALAIAVVSAHALADDDIDKAKAASQKRVLWRLEQAMQEVDDAEEILEAIAYSEAILFGKAEHPTIEHFRDRFSHPTLIEDYLTFERANSRSKPASGILATVEPLTKKLARLKAGLEEDMLTSDDVESDLDELEPQIPDAIALAPRKQAAEELVKRAEALTEEQLATLKPLKEAIEEYYAGRKDNKHGPGGGDSNADITQSIIDAFPGQPMQRMLDADVNYGILMLDTAEPTAQGYLTWVGVAYSYLRNDPTQATQFGLPAMSSKSIRWASSTNAKHRRQIKRHGTFLKDVTAFRNQISSPKLITQYIEWFELAQGYTFHRGKPDTPENVWKQQVQRWLNLIDRTAGSTDGTTSGIVTASFEQVLDKKRQSDNNQ